MPISTIVIVVGSWLVLLGLVMVFSVFCRDRGE